MQKLNPTATMQIASSMLVALTSRLTIGSAVCFTEGFVASILTITPKNHWFFLISTGMTFAIWLGFWRFRGSKLGADIGDLSFIDFILRSTSMMCFFSGIDSGMLWYPFTAISMLKIIRVYLWQMSLTQQHGWGTFGPMTLSYSKQHTPSLKGSRPSQALFGEIGIALVVAAIASVAIRQLGDFERVVAVWIVPLTFEFLYGPVQLRSLSAIRKNALASEQRETETAAENERLKREIAGVRAELEAAKKENDLLQKIQNSPSAEYIALLEAYEATKPGRQAQLVKIAKSVAKAFSATDKPRQ